MEQAQQKLPNMMKSNRFERSSSINMSETLSPAKIKSERTSVKEDTNKMYNIAMNSAKMIINQDPAKAEKALEDYANAEESSPGRYIKPNRRAMSVMPNV